MGQSLVAGLTEGAIYGLIAVGIVLVYKGTRVLNFAAGEIGGFSLFIAWIVIARWHQPWVVGALAAVATGTAIGLLFERIVVRTMGEATRLAVTVATIGLLLLLIGIETRFWGARPASVPPPIDGLGPRIFGYYVSPTKMLAVATLAALGIGLAAFLRSTDFGLGVLAASQDPAATRLVGVPLGHVSSFTWGVAGAVSAIAALLIAPSIGAVSVGLMTTLFVRGLAAALLGGLTSLPGAFAGGLGIGLIHSFVGHWTVQSTLQGLNVVAIMLTIIVILLFRPQGLLGKALR
jgi:branched-chain amino acid transport system permease protein